VRRATKASFDGYQAVKEWIKFREMCEFGIANPALVDMTALESLQKSSHRQDNLLRQGSYKLALPWIDRSPFISTQGYVGLAPTHTLPGDVICLVLGAVLPFIFREGDGGRYQLVGEAYIHGICDGEFMERSPEMKTFELY
jgi:hypothetical protein